MKKQLLLFTLLLCSTASLCASDGSGTGGTGPAGGGTNNHVHGFNATQPNTGPNPQSLPARQLYRNQSPAPQQPQGSPGDITRAVYQTTDRRYISAQPWQKKADAANHLAQEHFHSWRYLLTDYVSDMVSALALRSRNPNLIRTLQMMTLAAKSANGASATAAALAPRFLLAGYQKSAGDERIFHRALAGLMAVTDIDDAARSGKMLSNASTLSRLYRKNPELAKLLNKTSNKRMKNKTISMALAAVVGPFVWYIMGQPNNPAYPTLVSILVYNLLANAILDRKSENHGLENELVERAKKLAGRQKAGKPDTHSPKKKKKKQSPASDTVGSSAGKTTFAEMTAEELEELLNGTSNES